MFEVEFAMMLQVRILSWLEIRNLDISFCALKVNGDLFADIFIFLSIPDQ